MLSLEVLHVVLSGADADRLKSYRGFVIGFAYIVAPVIRTIFPMVRSLTADRVYPTDIFHQSFYIYEGRIFTYLSIL